MDVIFRDSANLRHGAESGVVAQGELLLRPREAAHRDCRALARLVVEHGCDALIRGDGPIERIVIQADPTLDDMLAATFAERLLAGQALPHKASVWADYAELARHGINPVGKVPVEYSLLGIYKAVRHEADEDLTDPENRATFLARWGRVVERLLAATETDADPYKTLLFDGAEFGPEHTVLSRDRDVFRQDLARGERWRISIPGGPQSSLGLLLRSPKSILFKEWSWQAADPALTEPPLLLAIVGGRTRWSVCTDAVQQLSLKTLADSLQAAEEAHHPNRPKNDPWFDGKPFKHTLIASPHDGGSLSDDQVLAIIKHWSKAVLVNPQPKGIGERLLTRRNVLVAGGTAAAAWVAARFIPKPPTPPIGYAGAQGIEQPREPTPPIGDKNRVDWQYAIDPDNASEVAVGPRPGKDFALLMATSDYEYWGGLPNPIPDAGEIKHVLEEKYGFETRTVQNPTRLQMIEALKSLHREYDPDDQLVIFIAGHGEIDPDTGLGFLVGHNTKKRRDDPDMESFLSHADVREIIERLSCRHILVIVDVCFGGKFDFNLGTQVAPPRGKAPEVTYKKVPRPEFIRRKLELCCRRYFASCGEFVTASDGLPGQHSPFVEQVLNSFRSGGANQGILTSQEILDAVLDLKVPPSFGTLQGHEDGGDMLFISKELAAAP